MCGSGPSLRIPGYPEPGPDELRACSRSADLGGAAAVRGAALRADPPVAAGVRQAVVALRRHCRRDGVGSAGAGVDRVRGAGRAASSGRALHAVGDARRLRRVRHEPPSGCGGDVGGGGAARLLGRRPGGGRRLPVCLRCGGPGDLLRRPVPDRGVAAAGVRGAVPLAAGDGGVRVRSGHLRDGRASCRSCSGSRRDRGTRSRSSST